MARECERGIVAQHPAAVIHDADETASAALDFDAHVRRTGVERVLEQFLDHRGRPFHYLAGSDFVRDIIRQDLDTAHQNSLRNCTRARRRPRISRRHPARSMRYSPPRSEALWRRWRTRSDTSARRCVRTGASSDHARPTVVPPTRSKCQRTGFIEGDSSTNYRMAYLMTML